MVKKENKDLLMKLLPPQMGREAFVDRKRHRGVYFVYPPLCTPQLPSPADTLSVGEGLRFQAAFRGMA